MKYKVTVVIPCYNSEDTLKRAIDSIINQSIGFENIELVLYDDASTDSTSNIIRNFSKKYPNIVPIFSKENSGFPGKGRNVGIKIANSDYVMFLDNDDKYDEKMCETLYNEIVESKSDLVSSAYINIEKFKSEKIQSKWDYGDEINDKIIFSGKTTAYFLNRMIWTCIFKKNILEKNNLSFPESKLAEDVYFMLHYLLNIEKIVYLKEYYGLFRYVQSDSLSNTLTLHKINGLFDIYETFLPTCRDEELKCSYIFEDRIHISLQQLYKTNAINENINDIYKFFERLKNFETSIRYNDKNLGFLMHIANNLICKNHFKLARYYLKFLKRLYGSKIMLLIYRKII